jgi:hypothetical protein
MKMKKSTAKAVLKPTVTPSTSAALTTIDVKTSAAPATINVKDSAALTTIDVKMDVGFGNAVFLRGQGSGLTWDRGTPMVCLDGTTWRWSQAVSDPITFKILLNDKVWSAGSDLTIAPGQKLEVAPQFS